MRLGFEPRGWDLSLEGGWRRRRRKKSPYVRKHRSLAPAGPLPKKGHSFVRFAPLTHLLAPQCCACSHHSLAFTGHNSQVFHRQNSLLLLRFCHYVGQSVHQSIRPSVSMYGGLLVQRSVCHSVCLSVHWSVSPSVYPSCFPFLGFGQKPILWTSLTLKIDVSRVLGDK